MGYSEQRLVLTSLQCLSYAELTAAELQNEIAFHPSFKATAVLHPSTYLNKVIVGGENGELQLWNTRTWCVLRVFMSLLSVC
jgi:hypothetical protein